MTTPPPPVVAAAAAIAGQPVPIVCQQRLPDGVGGVFWTDSVIYLADHVCADLRRFLHGHVDYETADAVLTLTHEAVHATGLLNETDTECAAIRVIGQTARALTGRQPTVAFMRLARTAHQMLRRIPGYANHPCR